MCIRDRLIGHGSVEAPYGTVRLNCQYFLKDLAILLEFYEQRAIMGTEADQALYENLRNKCFHHWIDLLTETVGELIDIALVEWAGGAPPWWQRSDGLPNDQWKEFTSVANVKRNILRAYNKALARTRRYVSERIRCPNQEPAAFQQEDGTNQMIHFHYGRPREKRGRNQQKDEQMPIKEAPRIYDDAFLFRIMSISLPMPIIAAIAYHLQDPRYADRRSEWITIQEGRTMQEKEPITVRKLTSPMEVDNTTNLFGQDIEFPAEFMEPITRQLTALARKKKGAANNCWQLPKPLLRMEEWKDTRHRMHDCIEHTSVMERFIAGPYDITEPIRRAVRELFRMASTSHTPIEVTVICPIQDQVWDSVDEFKGRPRRTLRGSGPLTDFLANEAPTSGEGIATDPPFVPGNNHLSLIHI